MHCAELLHPARGPLKLSGDDGNTTWQFDSPYVVRADDRLHPPALSAATPDPLSPQVAVTLAAPPAAATGMTTPATECASGAQGSTIADARAGEAEAPGGASTS